MLALICKLTRLNGHGHHTSNNGGVSVIIPAAFYPESVQKLVIWSSNIYVTKYDIEIIEKTRDVSDWSQQIRETMEGIYGPESLQNPWSGWIDSLKDIYDNLCMEEAK